MRYWLGPWVWNSLLSCWDTPPGVFASLDLRNRTHCGTAGGTPQGVGLFVTANATDLGSGYVNLGTDPTAVLSGARKSAFETLLSLPRALFANSIRAALYEVLTVQADPTDEDRCPPLLPTTRRDLEVWLGGEKVFERPFRFDLEEAAPVRDVLRRYYRRLRQASLEGRTSPLHYRKVLGYWVRKYGIASRWFQPDDLPDEPDLPPETTLSDNFNRSDADALGTASGGGTWTETIGDADIVSNRAKGFGSISNRPLARLESDLSSTDHYCELTAIKAVGGTSTVMGVGPACRFDSGADTFYVCRQQNNNVSTGTFRTSKVVTGTRTALEAGNTETIETTKRLVCNGSTLERYSGGVLSHSETDTSITTGTRCGIYWDRDEFAVDDWSAADLAVAAWPRNVFGNALVGPLARGVG